MKIKSSQIKKKKIGNKKNDYVSEEIVHLCL